MLAPVALAAELTPLKLSCFLSGEPAYCEKYMHRYSPYLWKLLDIMQTVMYHVTCGFTGMDPCLLGQAAIHHAQYIVHVLP